MGRTALRALGAVAALALAVWFAAPSSGAGGPFSFPHRSHLSAATIASGMKGAAADTDCRVCHDYTKPDREVHLKGCEKCHVDDQHLEKKVTGAYARLAFQHKEHLFDEKGAPLRDITCFTCHTMLVDQDWIEFTVPTSGMGPKARAGAVKTCADCHASHEPSGGVVKQDEKTGDGKACAQCHMKADSILPMQYRADVRVSGPRPFEHKDHGGAAADCDSCHGEIRKSQTIWDYDATEGTAARCSACHVDAAGKPLAAFSGSTTTVAKIDFSRFPHAAHLGTFTRMECRTCHFPETDAVGRKVFPGRVKSDEPVGRDALVRFDACDACHGAEGWAAGKPSWHVEGHGVGAWACFKCHEGTADAAGKLAVASAMVTRAGSVTLTAPALAHPGITQNGAALTDGHEVVGGVKKACTDCHVGAVAAIPTSTRNAPFDHRPHLPEKAGDAACVVCHPASMTSRRSEDMQRFDVRTQSAAIRDAAKARWCLECHVGTDLDAVGGSPGTPRRTPQFDHAGHVEAATLVPGEKGIGCTDCHVPGGEFGYSTPANVLSCTKCHAHEGDSAKVARTGPKTSQGDSAKCLFCHDAVRGSASGLIDAPPRETFTRTHLELAKGTQHHDKTGDCASCHVRDGAASVPYKERITKALVSVSIHDDPKFADRPFNDPKGNCAVCHRTEPRGYLRSLSKR